MFGFRSRCQNFDDDFDLAAGSSVLTGLDVLVLFSIMKFWDPIYKISYDLS